jgi:hypothetical protein
VRKIILLFFLSIISQQKLLAEKVAFDSPEGWGMSYMTAASFNLSDKFPETLPLGQFNVSAEISTIPELNEKQQKIGFGGVKSEDLNKSPVFGRGKITTGFYWDSLIEFSWTPPLEINGAKPEQMWGLAIAKQIYINDAFKTALRLYQFNGKATASVTCSEEMVMQPLYSPGNISGCIGTSKDKIDMSHDGIEILFEAQSSIAFKPWFSVASTRLKPSVQINAPLEFIQEEAFVETSGRLTTLTLGLNYKLSDNWLLNLGTSYTPIDVQRPEMTGGNDNFWNIKIGLTFLPN